MRHAPFLSPQNYRLIAAFLGGQAAMLCLVVLLRPASAVAQAEPEAVTAPAVIVRKSANGAGIQMSAGTPVNGPSLSFFDASGTSRIQISLDGKGTPTFLLRAKSGAIQMGIGLQNDQPVVAVRTADGALTPVPLPAGGNPSAAPTTTPAAPTTPGK